MRRVRQPCRSCCSRSRSACCSSSVDFDAGRRGMNARFSLRTAVLAYLGAVLLVPVGVVFYRTFEHGVDPAWAAVSTPDARHAFWLTLEIAAIAVPLNTVFGIACALAIVRRRFPGKGDRKSTRLNSSHRCISYAVFCLKKKKK